MEKTVEQLKNEMIELENATNAKRKEYELAKMAENNKNIETYKEKYEGKYAIVFGKLYNLNGTSSIDPYSYTLIKFISVESITIDGFWTVCDYINVKMHDIKRDPMTRNKNMDIISYKKTRKAIHLKDLKIISEEDYNSYKSQIENYFKEII